MTPEQIAILESKFTELLDDCIEIVSVNTVSGRNTPPGEDEYDAYIVYDGTNNQANHGHIHFTCSPKTKVIEDLNVLNITGSNYRKHIDL